MGDTHPTGIDIVVNDLVNLTCNGRYDTVPRYIEANVANYGQEDATNVPFHFQIYQERPLELEQYKLWDMESCILNTWDVVDNNGDGVTWSWTEKRSNSPTHSFHTQPDFLDTYEAYSNDSLILRDWFHVNSTVGDNTVSAAYLTFAYWCEGEFDGENPIDYGTIYIVNHTGRYKVGGPYYDTQGEWVVLRNATGDNAGIDISDWIGDDIKIEFNWIADLTGNYEGWYIDDVNIDYSYTAPQPLVWSDYQYADLAAGEEKVIKSQLPWGTIEDGYNYYIQIYMADTYLDDADPSNNELNCSVWFGDVCDAAIDDITVPSEVVFPHEDGYVSVPINVTVYNNGTLSEPVPVKVTVRHKITDVIVQDDVESGDIGWGDIWVTGDDTSDTYWKITKDDFYSPLHSWGVSDSPDGVSIHQGKVWQPIDPFVQGGLKWQSKLKWTGNFPSGEGVMPVFRAQTYYWDLSLETGRAPPFSGSSGGWYNFDADELIANNDMYWEQIPEYQDLIDAGEPEGLATLLEALNARYGPDGQDVEDFSQLEFGFIVEDDDGVTDDEAVYFDDFKLYHEYPGEVVWTDTMTTPVIEPGEYYQLNFTWNSTQYCNYFVTAEVLLGCDMDPNNNEKTTETRIYEQMYSDVEEYDTEDNTAGKSDEWHIVQECSICPDDHFWWNGNEDNDTYRANANDVLQIKDTFNFTDASEVWLNLSYWALLEYSTYNNWYFPGYYDYPWDFVVIEISNDSGYDWYPLDLIHSDNQEWTDLSYELVSWALAYGLNPATFFTDQMQIRFRFQSDASGQWKGVYIDDVSIDVDGNNTFFDDMENGDSKWFHEYARSYVMWHNETVFGAAHAPSSMWFWNGDTRNSPYNGDAFLTWLYLVYFYGGAYVHVPGDTTAVFPYGNVHTSTYDASFDEYRNNMDEKLIFEFDLTHAYEAILTFDQNYSFADDEDLGWLDVWTGSEWKPLLMMKGSADWYSIEYDISQYIDHSAPTKIRYRFESNATQVDYGWLIDNVSIEGKVDYTAPTCTASLSPATADGNNGWYKSSVTVTLTASDNVKMGTIYYRINGGSWLVYTAPFTISNDGSYVIDYYAVD
ncbi:MAG: hypothetical protein DRN33_05125, partial [Thermoplasmata archaeon]